MPVTEADREIARFLLRSGYRSTEVLSVVRQSADADDDSKAQALRLLQSGQTPKQASNFLQITQALAAAGGLDPEARAKQEEPGFISNVATDFGDIVSGLMSFGVGAGRDVGEAVGLVEPDDFSTLGALEQVFTPFDPEGGGKVPEFLNQSPFAAIFREGRSFGSELHKRPVSALLDALAVASLGGGTLARTGAALGKAGKLGKLGGGLESTGRALQRAGAAIDPAVLVGRGVRKGFGALEERFPKLKRTPIIGEASRIGRQGRQAKRQMEDVAVGATAENVLAPMTEHMTAMGGETVDALRKIVDVDGEKVDALRAHLGGRQALPDNIRNKPEFQAFDSWYRGQTAEHRQYLVQNGVLDPDMAQANAYREVLRAEGVWDPKGDVAVQTALEGFRTVGGPGGRTLAQALQARGFRPIDTPEFMSFVLSEEAMRRAQEAYRNAGGRLLGADVTGTLKKFKGVAPKTGDYIQDPFQSIAAQFAHMEQLKSAGVILQNLSRSQWAERLDLKGLDLTALRAAKNSTERAKLLEQAVADAGMEGYHLFSPQLPLHLARTGAIFRQKIGIFARAEGESFRGLADKITTSVERSLMSGKGPEVPQVYKIKSDVAELILKEVAPELVGIRPIPIIDTANKWLARLALGYSPRWLANTAIGSTMMSLAGGNLNPLNYAAVLGKGSEFAKVAPKSLMAGNIGRMADNLNQVKSLAEELVAEAVGAKAMQALQPPTRGVRGVAKKAGRVLADKLRTGMFPYAQAIDNFYKKAFLFKELKRTARVELQMRGVTGWLNSVLHHRAVAEKVTELARGGRVRKLPEKLQRQYDVAVDNTLKYLIDYNDLSHVERVWHRRLFPFYNWFRGITTLMVRMGIENPTRVKTMQALSNVGLEASDHDLAQAGLSREDLPVYWRGAVVWPGLPRFFAAALEPFGVRSEDVASHIDGPEGVPILLTNAINPYETVNEVVEFMTMQRSGGGVPGALNPAVKWGLENMTGRSLFTGKPLEKVEDGLLVRTGDIDPATGEPRKVTPSILEEVLGMFPPAEVAIALHAPFRRAKGGDIGDFVELLLDPESKAVRGRELVEGEGGELERVIEGERNLPNEVLRVLGMNIKNIDVVEQTKRGADRLKRINSAKLNNLLSARPDLAVRLARMGYRPALDWLQKRVQEKAKDNKRSLFIMAEEGIGGGL